MAGLSLAGTFKASMGKHTLPVVAALAVLVFGLLGYSGTAAYADEGATAPAVTTLQTQSGDNVEEATPVSLNASVGGAASAYRDEDWYKVTLPKAGKFQVKFSGKYKSSGYWRVSLRDRNNAEMWGDSVYASDCLSGSTVTMHTTGLPAGTYYVCVTGYNVDSVPYKLTSSFAASGVWEREWNDNVEQPNAIPLGKAVNGTSKKYGDEDWYKVTLPKAGKFQVKFSGKYKSSGYWRVSLRDRNNAEMWGDSVYASDCLSKGTVTMHTTGLPAGTYYVCVYGRNVDSVPYKLTPVFAASGVWEREWNDNVEQPNAIPLGKAVNGTSKKYGDEDWYKVTLPKAGKFQVKFSGKYKSSGYWRVSLRDRNNNEIAASEYEAQTRNTRSMMVKSLKAGTYYVCVYGRNVDSVPYSLTPRYYVASPSISKVVAGSKAFTAKWGKVSGATSYQVRYSTKSNMKSAKTVTVSQKSLTKKITKLKGAKKYYVQVRAVKKVDGKTYYSAWSAKKAVKTKK